MKAPYHFFSFIFLFVLMIFLHSCASSNYHNYRSNADKIYISSSVNTELISISYDSPFNDFKIFAGIDDKVNYYLLIVPTQSNNLCFEKAATIPGKHIKEFTQIVNNLVTTWNDSIKNNVFYRYTISPSQLNSDTIQTSNNYKPTFEMVFEKDSKRTLLSILIFSHASESKGYQYIFRFDNYNQIIALKEMIKDATNILTNYGFKG